MSIWSSKTSTQGWRKWVKDQFDDNVPTSLTGLSDVDTAAVTNKFALMADGTNYVGRAVVEADIDDLQSYTLPADALTTIVGNGNWKVFYTGATGIPVELTLGAANTVLTSAGATSAPTFAAAAAGGIAVQVVNAVDGTLSTTTATIPNDNTVPTITEGKEFMTLAITPTNSSNLLHIQHTGVYSDDVARNITCALFQDTTTAALCCVIDAVSNPSFGCTVTLNHWMVAGTTDATTFRIRAADLNADTFCFNGINTGTARMGGSLSSTMTITEYLV